MSEMTVGQLVAMLLREDQTRPVRVFDNHADEPSDPDKITAVDGTVWINTR